MEFSIEKYISQFVESQFPDFYKEQGPTFIAFVKAYYEWLESNYSLVNSSNTVITNDLNVALKPPIRQSRNLLEYRDIDTTLTEFLEFFQKKYLYGIPFNIIINKRYLLKHILDVYRSKGSLQCYKLLFRLIYDEDMDVYLPGQDMLRVSDGKWKQPKYLEVTENDNLNDFIGMRIEGVSSGTTATVENYIREVFNKNIINTLYISNILPKGGEFYINEKIVFEGQTANNAAVSVSPTIIGSLDKINIINGGQDFNVGDIIKIAQKDPVTQEYISYGVDGILKVSEVRKSYGQLYFDIVSGGFGYLANAETYLYANTSDNPTSKASFDIFAIADAQRIEYNTDLICDFANLTLNSTSFGFPANTSANLTTNVGICFSRANNIFGSIVSLTNINTGNGYNYPANTFVRSVQLSSNVLQGNITYNSSYLHVASIRNTNTSATGYSNTDIITVNNSRANVDITENRESDPSQVSLLTLVSNNYTVNVFANSAGYSNTTNTLKISNANTIFSANDLVFYQIQNSGDTAIGGLTSGTYYYVNFTNSSCISLSTTHVGTNATISMTTNSTGGNLSLTITNPGSIFFNKTSNVIVSNSSGGSSNGSGATFSIEYRPYILGNNTIFTSIYSNNDVIWLKANSSLTSTVETQIIRYVSNSTLISLYGPPSHNSTSSAQYKAAPVILPSNFALYDSVMVRPDGTINGKNEIITAVPSFGNGVIQTVVGVNSGKAYLEGEEVVAYLYGALNTPTLKNPGTGYSNGDILVFIGGGGTVVSAEGFITTHSNGAISYATLTYAGSGYITVPTVLVRSSNGYGAELFTSITEFNTVSRVSGRVVKTGVGRGSGYWETTDGFLNSDKYIQDSYYYQDYSYEIKAALTLDKYKDILKDTFHTAGSELFGKFLLNTKVNYEFAVLEETLSTQNAYTCDSVNISCDNIDIELSML